jgi:transcriptional regulator with XRE-family HTH domain
MRNFERASLLRQSDTNSQDLKLDWTEIVHEARRRRKEERLTQKRLAIIADVPLSAVSRLEAGRKDLQLSSALAILRVLNMVDRGTEGSLIVIREGASPDEGPYAVMFAPYAGAGRPLQRLAMPNQLALREFLLALGIEGYAQKRVLAQLFLAGSATVTNMLLRQMEIARFWPEQTFGAPVLQE